MRAVADLDPVGLGATFAGIDDGRIRPLEASFPAATLTADGLFRAGPGRLLHFEYKGKEIGDLIPQLLIYRGMIMKRFPRHHIEQHVVVLGAPRVKGYQDLERQGFALDLRVWYLREMDPQLFLARRAMAPLAVLARGTRQQRAGYLAQALEAIGNEADNVSNTLREVASVMATIRLDRPTIEGIVKESGMSSESIAEFYEGTSFGQELVAKGRQEGREFSLASVYTLMIQGKFGDREEVELVARRLARLPEASALKAVEAAASFDELLAGSIN